jgi:hypothetical protein
MALDDVQITSWDFLRRRKSRTAEIDTNAIIMDFRVEGHVTVTDEDEEDETRRGHSLGAERRSGSDRQPP